jgi:hypothetical protein
MGGYRKSGSGYSGGRSPHSLGLIILALARDGKRDEREMTEIAVRYMNREPIGAMRH